MKKTFAYSALVLGTLVFAYPFVWMVLAAFKPELEIGSLNPLPSQWTWDSFRVVFTAIPIGRAFLNSVLVTGAVTASALVFGSMAAYALSKLQWRGRDAVFNLILFTMMVPFLVMLIPLYTLIVGFCLYSALSNRDRFGALLTIGISGTFFVYFSINMGMVMGLLPVVGSPLPLVSYGGTAMMILLMGFGMVQSAHVHRPR